MTKKCMMSQPRYNKLQEELQYLRTTRAAEVEKMYEEALEEARRSGDLENTAHYKAMGEQRRLEGRIAEVEETLRQTLREELDYLRNIRAAEVEKALEEARRLGDLAENSAYDTAKEEQSRLHARIAEVEKTLQGYELAAQFTVYKAALVKYKGSGGNVTIPGSVERIADGVFEKCTSLTRITIPESVTHIGAGAFAGCMGLTRITIPESVTHIGAGAFAGCTNLAEIVCVGNQSYCTIDDLLLSRDGSVLHSCPSGKTGEIVIPESVTEIESKAFSGCSGLASVVIPESVTKIGSEAFFGCSSLTSITIPENVGVIGDHAFRLCSSLTSVKIPEGVARIGYGTFFGCSNLAHITIPESVIEIGRSAFCKCNSLTSVAIPERVKVIAQNAFSECTSLAHITIPESVIEIGRSAFYKCSSLTSVAIPERVKVIAQDAFSECTGLAHITIPESVTEIGRSAFYKCSSLTSVTISKEVRIIKIGAFSNCTGLTEIQVEAGNQSYCVKNGLVLSRDGSVLYICPAGKTGELVIPEGVTEIVQGAFKGCSGLTSVAMPRSVRKIGGSAFSGCSSLASVTISEVSTENR